MFLTSPPLTIISLIIIPLLSIIVFFYTRNIQKSTKKEKKKQGEVANIATDAMAKIMEIKAFTLEKLMFKQFQEKSEARFEAGKRAGILQSQFTPLVDIVLAFGTGVIMLVGATAFIQGSVSFGFLTLTAQQASLGTLTVFLAYLAKLYQPLRDLSKLTTLASSATSAGTRIQDVLDEKPEPLDDLKGYTGPRQLQGNISYQDVFFSYEAQGRLILKGVTLDIPTSKKIALVGLSGSGKTTLTNLLTRFYDLPKDRGLIKLDGRDINDFPLAVVRQNISMVLQDSILFEGTIAENIRIGNPNATDEEMKKAAELAVIHETIVNKLGGYERKITGRDLSGGQRQRIAIARAILRNSPIIIMDEPTAALDAEAEAEVMRALDSLAEKRTVLMITHRLTTVGKVDQIVVLQDGRIAELGTFKELRRKGGIFYKLLSLQNLLTSEDENEGTSIMRTSLVRPDPGRSRAQVEFKVNRQTIGTRELDKVVLTIGSLTGNDILISSPYISRLHAKILWEENGWVIRDADSLNKVYFNGNVIEEHRLTNGDGIYLGHPNLKPPVELVYRGVNAAPVKPTVPMKARIVVEVDGQPIGMKELNKAVLMVGREPGKDVPLDVMIPDTISTKEVSRLQAQIQWENGAWVIKKDQNAKNKLFYNGVLVDQHVLMNGDRVFLAPKVALVYEAMAPVGAR
jgi:ABC-type multidrug transport system fused ATPase/permease subunit/pSer/pThr/pTyr-binding forkhead associated (FHA) protein